MTDERSPILKLCSLNKSYRGQNALSDISLDVQDGEFIAVLGPNGSGKSTMLKILAGVENATGGNWFYDGKSASTFANSHPRDIVMVWQSLALFPHMNVGANVGFGLKVRKVSSDEQKVSVSEALNKVGLAGYEKRHIQELSGGEQQRVAVARALVLKPRILLLDEPFGSVDVQLRSQLQALLFELHRRQKLTILIVTHDVSEGLALASRILVLNKGRLEQIGTARELLKEPRTGFVARFVGHKNVFSGTISGISSDTIAVSTAAGQFLAVRPTHMKTEFKIGDKVAYILDPAKVSPGAPGGNHISAQIEATFIFGSSQIVRARTSGLGQISYEDHESNISNSRISSTNIILRWAAEDAFVLPDSITDWSGFNESWENQICNIT